MDSLVLREVALNRLKADFNLFLLKYFGFSLELDYICNSYKITKNP